TQGIVEQTTDAQLSTLILDNRKKLNEIIDSILQSCINKVDEAVYELESPAQVGNVNSTPEYTLSMIEKAVNNATEFATVFDLYLGQEKGGDHVDVIKSANEFAHSLSEVLVNTKGITRLTSTDEASDQLVAIAKLAGETGMRFFLNLQSYKIELVAPANRREIPLRVMMESRTSLNKLSTKVEELVPKGKGGSLAKAN
ncbi:4701_t:CDS:2, partial [Acaulospora colombiana]